MQRVDGVLVKATNTIPVVVGTAAAWGSAAAAFKGGSRRPGNGYNKKAQVNLLAVVGAMVLGLARLGGASFTDVASTASVGDTSNGRGIAVADYDGDGDLDLYVTNNGANVLYQNDNNGIASITLVIKPLTGAGAPSIFGAVKLSTSDGNVVALRMLDSGSGYCSQNR